MDTELDADMEFFNNIQIEESTEVPPEMPAPKSNALECQTCGKPLTYGGRGPKPKYCADHKKRSNNSSSTKPRSKKNTGTDYREGILGLIQMPVMGLAIAGAKNPVLAADAITISAYAPGIADAINALANERPEIAAALERVLAVGPYGALIGALIPMAIQILANHELIPAGIMNTVSKEELFAQEQARMEQQMREAFNNA